ncbi:MAG: hypothetical protein KGL39_40150 [Patescibacteria group bacterium]|nr:hypothetical protein [Patescibacteria group bacterium]
MKNRIYLKTFIGSAHTTDGETPFQLHVTEEINGYGVFTTGHDTGTTLLKWFGEGERDKALEWAILDAPKSTKVQELLAKELREPTEEETK